VRGAPAPFFLLLISSPFFLLFPSLSSFYVKFRRRQGGCCYGEGESRALGLRRKGLVFFSLFESQASNSQLHVPKSEHNM
jgi:hypothetical protein